MKPGDLVFDKLGGPDLGIILEKAPVWFDADGQPHYWDYKLWGPDGIWYADRDELEVAKETNEDW